MTLDLTASPRDRVVKERTEAFCGSELVLGVVTMLGTALNCREMAVKEILTF